MHTQKAILRKHALQTLISSPADDAALCALFLKTFPPEQGQTLSFFWPMRGEPDTRAIATAFHAAGASVTLPVIRTDGAHGLKFRLWAPGTALQKTAFGTLEPENTPFLEPDIMLIPMLMADASGNRLGRGAGHFDATLNARRPALAAGIIYDHQLSSTPLPHEPHDQRLDTLITPTRVLRF